MHWIWATGLVVPALLVLASALMWATRHRLRDAVAIGTVVGGGFCLASWTVLRWSLAGSDRAMEILFLQIALSTAGTFVFVISAMLALRFLGKRPHT